MHILICQLCTERPRFQGPPPPSTNSDEDGDFGGSSQEKSRHQLPAPCSRTSRPRRRSPVAMDEEPEVTPVRSRSSRDLPDGERHWEDPGIANWDIHSPRKRQAIINSYNYKTSEEDCQVSLESDKDPRSEEVSSSDDGGHDYRQPRRRNSSKFFGASNWTKKEWKIVLASDNISNPRRSQ
jgi:hypothetical protein